MGSPLAVVGLTWDGHDIQRSDLDLFFELTEGLDELPEHRGEDQVVPFRAGRLPGLRLPHRRPIVATGHVMGPSGASARPAFRAYVDQLKGWMDPTAGERVLAAAFEDGSSRWIACAARDILPGDGFAGEYRALSLEWEAVSDPLWHAAWGAWALDSGLYLDTGWRIDEAGHVVINPTASPFDVTFTALGTTRTTDVRVEVDGASTGAVGVSVTSLSPAVGFTHPALAGGAHLVVDSGARTALLGGAQARGSLALLAGNAHGEYIRLAAGPNTVRVTGTPAEVRIYFDRSYL